MNLHLSYMKKICTTLLSILCVISAMAQSPRAVIKSIMEGDKPKAIERLEKINLKTRNEMPEMCILAEAALLNMEEQSEADKLRGYEMLATHISEIRESLNSEKVFKGDDTTLDEVIRTIEQRSFEAVVAKNSETAYRDYLRLAAIGNHSDITTIRKKLETKVYEGIIKQRSIGACDAFLSEFSESEYRPEVEAHRTNLYYDEAMKTTDEAIMESFIANFPDHERVDNVTTRLMEQRYKRIVRSEDINQMRWFVDRYPNYHLMDSLKQIMANIEYPTLEDSREALEAFVEYYPKVRQAAEAKSRIVVFRIIERGDIGEIFQYIKKSGYDRNYTRMQHAIAKKHGYIILSQDINTVSLIRFRTIDGKVGYLNHEGRVAVEAQYELKGYMGLGIPSKHAKDIFECTTERGMALVIKDNKMGAINSQGRPVIPTEYTDIAFLDNEVICVKSNSASADQRGVLNCSVYDYKGVKVADERNYTTGPSATTFHNWDTTWFSTHVTIKDSYDEWEKSLYVDGKYIGSAYGGFHELTPHYRWFQAQNDEKINVISRNGNVITLNFHSYDIEVIYNNIVMAESISSGNRCVIDLDKQSIISKDKFRDMWAMSDDVILVQYLDNSFGFVGRNLTPVINQRYDRAYSFSCGTAAVIKGSQGYIIDKSGKQISAYYDDIAPLSGCKGLYKVMLNGKCGIVDANDDIIVEIEHQPIKQSHYTSDKLSSVNCTNGVIEWGDGTKSLIFSK